MRKQGFSFIELLVVVAIIGVLASIAIPAYNRYITNSRKVAVQTIINDIEQAFIACYRDREFGSYIAEGQTDTVKKEDCSEEKNLKGYIEAQGLGFKSDCGTCNAFTFVVSHRKKTDNTQSCWSVKHNKAGDGKGVTQCADFKFDKRGLKNNHYLKGSNGNKPKAWQSANPGKKGECNSSVVCE